MREIKFRGYSPYKNGWVYGDLVHDKKVTETGLEDRVKVGGYEVDPDSVGQFTGLLDSGTRELYEGDIFSYKIDPVEYYGVIEWSSYGYYSVRWVDDYDHAYIISTLVDLLCIRLIGNIYENKELVKNLRK